MDLAEQVDPEEWHGILDRVFKILTDGDMAGKRDVERRFSVASNCDPGAMSLFETTVVSR
jgi:hypothetical protein